MESLIVVGNIKSGTLVFDASAESHVDFVEDTHDGLVAQCNAKMAKMKCDDRRRPDHIIVIGLDANNVVPAAAVARRRRGCERPPSAGDGDRACPSG